IYAGSLPRTKIIKTFRPSENEFKKLYGKFSNTLKCPCSQVAIQYSYFTNIDVKFHEVCESKFITQDWIDSVYHVNVSIIPPNDVRTIMSNFWQFIRSFCNLTKETFTDAYTDFNATILLTPVTQSQFFIETNVEASLNFSVTSVVSNLKRNLFISRETTLVNGFMSSLATNYHMESVYYASSPNTARVQSRAKIFEDGCVCSNLRGCPRPVSIFDLNTKSIETNITGQALVNQYQKLITIIRSTIHNLNLFKTTFANDDIVRRQHITSWVYIFCITISLLILSSYWLLSNQMKIVTLSNPSLADYNRLWVIHSHNLECPCSQIFIPHLNFIHIEPVFHQLCSSKITSPNWYRNLEIADDIREYSTIM
ncbi:unnamed protein product, partial [Rotaria sp. Silwood1]